jgi:hypothetical protein
MPEDSQCRGRRSSSGACASRQVQRQPAKADRHGQLPRIQQSVHVKLCPRALPLRNRTRSGGGGRGGGRRWRGCVRTWPTIEGGGAKGVLAARKGKGTWWHV